MVKKFICELIGTAVLCYLACGVAVMTGSTVAIALAFGLVIVAMAYSIGNISGCHINPAVTIAKMVRKEMSVNEGLVYICAQVVGAFVGSLLLALSVRSFDNLGGNQIQVTLYSEAGKLDAMSYIGAFVAEVVLTCIFVFVILAVTDKKHNLDKLAGIIIGATLTLVHLCGLGLTGTSVNPARSLAPAVLQAFAGNTASLKQVWIWILAPLAGGVVAALVYGLIFGKNKDTKEAE